jgi:hypothetical protein
MPEFLESGLKIILPDDHSFRLQDCQVYKKLSGKNLSEMDFGWYDITKNILLLLEIKEYSELQPEDKLIERLLPKLVDKATDTLLILSSIWSKSAKGQELATDLPVSCQNFPQRIKIVFVFNIHNPQLKMILPILKTKLNSRLKGRIALFDLRDITLTDPETAMKMGISITLSNSH